MSKYIKLEDAIHNINLEVTGRKEYTGDMKANLFFALDDLPTIDIVTCKECKRWLGESEWYEEREYKQCQNSGMYQVSTHFCAWGERIKE